MTPGFVSFPRQGVSVQVDIAESPEELARGLMGRTELDEMGGMLFWLGTRTNHVFTMRRTRIPLDLIFLDYDRVVGVLSLQPTEGDGHQIHRPSTTVLEVNGGFAARHDVKVGDRVVVSLA
jgi:uncharacterized membrane protein (UPF0127 family)